MSRDSLGLSRRGVGAVGMGGHSLPNRGESDVWLTPPWIIRRLGRFDLDPCAAPDPRPWDTAALHVSPPRDGLAFEWAGRVWLNPPYGAQTGAWMERLAAHGCGSALIFARTETECWHQHVWPKASAILFLEGRLFFHRADGSKAQHNAGAPSAIIAYGSDDARRLQGAGVEGFFVDLTPGYNTSRSTVVRGNAE
jgi:DNA N-6-adenine-methyltransferase (Dam)